MAIYRDTLSPDKISTCQLLISIFEKKINPCFSRVVNKIRLPHLQSVDGALRCAAPHQMRAGANMADKITTPPQFKAKVWKHFGFQVKSGSKNNKLEKENAVCKLCFAAVKYCGNTTNLRTHLTRHHPKILAQRQPPRPVELKQTTLGNFLPSTSPHAQRITVIGSFYL